MSDCKKASSTKIRLLKKLRARNETKAYIREDVSAEQVIINRGAYGDAYRWSIPLCGIASDCTATDVLKCKLPLIVTKVSSMVEVDVPNSEMRRIHPGRAAKGIYYND